MITKIVLTIEHKYELPYDLLGGILFKAYGMIGGEGSVVAEFLEPKAEIYDPFQGDAKSIRGIEQ